MLANADSVDKHKPQMWGYCVDHMGISQIKGTLLGCLHSIVGCALGYLPLLETTTKRMRLKLQDSDHGFGAGGWGLGAQDQDLNLPEYQETSAKRMTSGSSLFL